MRQSMPAIYYAREFAAAGGLISYASSFAIYFVRRRPTLGAYSKARTQATYPLYSRPSSNWSSNLKTAKSLGLEIPFTLLARADEVIE